MTLKDFGSKYDLPINQIKAAMNVPRGAVKCIHDMHTDYPEEELVLEMTRYYMVDMRFCIERAAKDNEMLKKLAEKMPPA